MPPASTTYCYGCLSLNFDTTLSIGDLLWGKTASGFILFNWFPHLTKEDKAKICAEHSGLLKGPLSTKAAKEFTLDEIS